MKNALEVNGLCKSYPAFGLRNVSFELPQGYIMGFIGPNGAGKTTTIKLILNIISAQSGSVSIFGNGGSIAENSNIGVVMDTPMYVDEWSIADVENALSPFYKNWDGGLFSGYLSRFGLEPGKKVNDLSRGMKVKLQIATALSHGARLLILDEPTSGLDPIARDEICDILREFVTDEGKSVLFSTHITSDLEKTADYITFIMAGGIVYTGTKDELLEKYARVTGGIGELDAAQRGLVIGYREHSTGFEGMIETKNIGKLPGSVLAEDVNLDEIIIFMNKGVSIDE